LVVNTWFMDPRLAELLPVKANPVRLQRAAYLYPVPAGQGGLWFVFLQDIDKTDPADPKHLLAKGGCRVSAKGGMVAWRWDVYSAQ
jgi:hypothetical protein